MIPGGIDDFVGGVGSFVGGPPTEEVVAAGAVMNQIQGPNLGADLFNGTLIGLFLLITGKAL